MALNSVTPASANTGDHDDSMSASSSSGGMKHHKHGHHMGGSSSSGGMMMNGQPGAPAGAPPYGAPGMPSSSGH